jgi:hypothetical protein
MFINTGQEQSLLKGLYDLELFPTEMERSKNIINQTSTDILMYNFINGGNGGSQSDLRPKDSIVIQLPFTEYLFKF